MSKTILKERAEQLSKMPQGMINSGSGFSVVLFYLAKEVYAIETEYVQEVFPVKEVAILPCVPSFVVGLINVRRKIISVIDLRVLFDLPIPKALGGKAIILKKNDLEFAILTDGILSVSFINPDDIQPPLPTLRGIQQEFLKGITSGGTVVLSGDQFMSHKHIIVNGFVD